MTSVPFPPASKNLVSASQRAFPSGSKPSGRVTSVIRAGGAPIYGDGVGVVRGGGAKRGARKKLASTEQIFCSRSLLPLRLAGHLNASLLVQDADQQHRNGEEEEYPSLNPHAEVWDQHQAR